MPTAQFRVLYRHFLFRMVDLELLSAHALGDMSRLFGQFASLLLFISIGLALFGFGVADSKIPPEIQLIVSWSGEHFLIATTMLVTGLFAVLSWDATFPERRDVFVLAPLPVRTKTILLAKVAAVATALSIAVLMLHAIAGLVWPLALNKDTPAQPAPALTYDSAMQPVDTPGLEKVLSRDLAQSLEIGPLAPGRGGGVSIGVWKRGVRRVIAYGTAKPDSIFEIGSISKTFTALILAQLIQQGKARLGEPVRELLPAGTAAKPAGREITLLDLVTHHSGLPVMPTNFNAAAGQPNPGADYRASDLYAFLARHGLARPARVRFGYSNLGFGLLGQALADRAGTTYSNLLEQEVTSPLGMKDTALSLSREQLARMIQGYDWRSRAVPPWDLDALAGAGAIRSTAGDILTYLIANLHPETAPRIGTLPAALVATHELRADVMPGMRIALGWIYTVDTGTYWHNGAIGGYSSNVFFDPANDCAAVVLLNHFPGAFSLADVLAEHIHQRFTGKPAISLATVMVPMGGGVLRLVRGFLAYWVTMFAAGSFIFCCVLGIQGVAAQLLPRRHFLRASSFLQLGAFCLLVSVYFLEPTIAAPGLIALTQSHAMEWSPSYWFLGLLQQLNGSPALTALAHRAWIGFAVASVITALSYLLSYFRTLRRIVEEPDILPSSNRGWLPRFGNAFQTAVGQFSTRTLLRSRQHRLLLAFYLGIGFAILIFFTKAPLTRELSDESSGDWARVSVALLGSSILMMGLWILGARIVFSLPKDLRANWIFRITPVRGGLKCLTARRRTLYVLSVIPVWMGSAVLFLSIWPWQAAVGHLLVLGLLGAILAELCLQGIPKLPFTCSYLPGKSYFHMTFLLCSLLAFTLIAKAAQWERRVLEERLTLAVTIVILAILWICARWRTRMVAQSQESELQFEDERNPAIFALDLHRDGVTPIALSNHSRPTRVR